jgi:hypothetical protein
MFRQLSKFLPLAALLAASPGFAEEPAGLSVRALLLAPGGPVVALHPMSGEVVGGEIQIGARGLSDSFKAPSRAFDLAMPDTKKESGFRAVGRVELPEVGQDFIILLEPAKSSFKVHVVNAKDSGFGADCVLFFNASDVNIGGILGAKKVLVTPRKAVFAKAPPRGEKPYYQVTFFEPDGGRPRPFANTRWPHREGSRCYVFFYRSNAAGRLTYQAVDEDLRPVATPE